MADREQGHELGDPAQQVRLASPELGFFRHVSNQRAHTVLSPSNVTHIPRAFLHQYYDVEAVLRDGLHMQIDAEGTLDPEPVHVHVANYQNQTGHSYHRLLNFKTVCRKYLGWRVEGWQFVDGKIVRICLSPPTTDPAENSPAIRPVTRPARRSSGPSSSRGGGTRQDAARSPAGGNQLHRVMGGSVGKHNGGGGGSPSLDPTLLTASLAQVLAGGLMSNPAPAASSSHAGIQDGACQPEMQIILQHADPHAPASNMHQTQPTQLQITVMQAPQAGMQAWSQPVYQSVQQPLMQAPGQVQIQQLQPLPNNHLIQQPPPQQQQQATYVLPSTAANLQQLALHPNSLQILQPQQQQLAPPQQQLVLGGDGYQQHTATTMLSPPAPTPTAVSVNNPGQRFVLVQGLHGWMALPLIAQQQQPQLVSAASGSSSMSMTVGPSFTTLQHPAGQAPGFTLLLQPQLMQPQQQQMLGSAQQPLFTASQQQVLAVPPPQVVAPAEQQLQHASQQQVLVPAQQMLSHTVAAVDAPAGTMIQVAAPAGQVTAPAGQVTAAAGQVTAAAGQVAPPVVEQQQQPADVSWVQHVPYANNAGEAQGAQAPQSDPGVTYTLTYGSQAPFQPQDAA